MEVHMPEPGQAEAGQQPQTGVAQAQTPQEAPQGQPGTVETPPAPLPARQRVEEYIRGLDPDGQKAFQALAAEMSSTAFTEQNKKFQQRVSEEQKRAQRAEDAAKGLADPETLNNFSSSQELLDSFKQMATQLGVPGVRWISRTSDLQEAMAEHLSQNPLQMTGAQSTTTNGTPLESMVAETVAKTFQERFGSNGALAPPGGESPPGAGNEDFLQRFNSAKEPLTKENMERVGRLTGTGAAGDKPLIPQ
jgi:hypothetical protein